MLRLIIVLFFTYLTTVVFGQVSLTEEEKTWITLHQNVTFGADKDWAPLVIVNNLGQVEGYDRDILDEIESLTGLQVTIQPGNWSKLVQDAMDLKIDGLTYSSRVPEREKVFNFTSPYIRFEAGFYSHVDKPLPDDMTSMSGSKVAVQGSDEFSSNFVDRQGVFEKVVLANRQEIVAALLTKQVDYYFGAIDLDYYLSTNVIPGVKLAYLVPTEGYEAVFSVRKDYRLLTSILNKAIAAIPDTRRAELMRKWSLGRKSVQNVNTDLVFTISMVAFGIVFMLLTWVLTLKRVIGKRKAAEQTLEQYKVNLESLIENSAGLVYLLDFNLRVIVCNSNFTKFIHGISHRQMKIGDNLSDFLPEKYREEWIERYAKGLCGEKYDVEDYTDITGTYRNFVTYLNPIMINEKVVGLSCFTEDISAYTSLNRYMINMMDNTYDYVFIKDLDRKFIVASQVMADVNGLESWRSFIGKTDFDIHPENAIQFEEHERAVIEEGKSFVNLEKSFIDKDGSTRWVQSTNMPILDEDSRVMGLLGVSRDITEAKRQNEANRTMLSVLDNSGDFVAFFDRDMKFLYMNKVARNFYGSDDYLGQQVGKLMHPTQFEARKLNVLKLIKEGGVDREEVDVYRPGDGEKLTLDSVVVAVTDDDGQFLCFGNIGRNVTERNKLQEEVVAARLQKEVMMASMQAEDLERSRLAHELHDSIQQRLATLSISLQVSKDRPQLLSENISLLNNIIDEVRDISHNLSPSTLKSMGLSFAMADEIKRLNEIHSIRFKYYENVGTRRFDELLELNLYRVFQESLTNILKHAQANEVMIQLLFSDNNLSLSIEDDGIGFDTSERLSNGIGLYNMKRRIQAFNGRIDIESSLQYGTTVMLDINL